jgi:hypothetical protein
MDFGDGRSLALCLSMKERSLTIPEIMLIVSTRVALGAGVGLLLSGKLKGEQRRGAGWALVAVGALTTIPIVASIFGKARTGNPTAIAA